MAGKSERRQATPAVACLGLGVVLVVGYFVLRTLEVGGIGQPSDIGGGLILLAGLVVLLAGAALFGLDVARRRRSR